jgi:PPOX class probable F420-dependent enzyme
VNGPVSRLDGWQLVAVTEAPVARLATTRPDGRPHVVPMTFALLPGEYADALVTAVDAKPKRTTDLQRLRNIAANPAVSLLVDHYDSDWTRLWWVRLDGTARVVVQEPERGDLLEQLLAKYVQYRDRPPDGPVVVIEVSTVVSWRGDVV